MVNFFPICSIPFLYELLYIENRKFWFFSFLNPMKPRPIWACAARRVLSENTSHMSGEVREWRGVAPWTEFQGVLVYSLRIKTCDRSGSKTVTINSETISLMRYPHSFSSCSIAQVSLYQFDSLTFLTSVFAFDWMTVRRLNLNFLKLIFIWTKNKFNILFQKEIILTSSLRASIAVRSRI